MNGLKSFRHKLYKRASLVLSLKLIFRIKFRDGVRKSSSQWKTGEEMKRSLIFSLVSKKNVVIKKRKKKKVNFSGEIFRIDEENY